MRTWRITLLTIGSRWFEKIGRLGHEVAHPGPQRLNQQVFILKSGHQDGRHVVACLLDLTEEVQAACSRGKRWSSTISSMPPAATSSSAFGGRCGRDHDVACPLELELLEPGDTGVVLDEQNLCVALRSMSVSSSWFALAAIGDANDLEKQPQPIDRLDKRLIVDGLGDIDAAAQLVAALDFARIIGGGQHDHRNQCGLRVGLQLAEDFNAVDSRHLDVEQEQDRLGLSPMEECRGRARSRALPGRRSSRTKAVGDADAAQVALHQLGVAIVIVNEQRSRSVLLSFC